jgi:hypothetical protein
MTIASRDHNRHGHPTRAARPFQRSCVTRGFGARGPRLYPLDPSRYDRSEGTRKARCHSHP